MINKNIHKNEIKIQYIKIKNKYLDLKLIHFKYIILNLNIIMKPTV